MGFSILEILAGHGNFGNQLERLPPNVAQEHLGVNS
jgi:hypothetical protein